jgi:putative Ca2+/H+ antiporter (TMEM165/GDT1 family)
MIETVLKLCVLGTLRGDKSLSLLSIIAIYSGKFISDKVDKETLAKIAGIISFILLGIAFFF